MITSVIISILFCVVGGILALSLIIHEEQNNIFLCSLSSCIIVIFLVVFVLTVCVGMSIHGRDRHIERLEFICKENNVAVDRLARYIKMDGKYFCIEQEYDYGESTFKINQVNNVDSLLYLWGED